MKALIVGLLSLVIGSAWAQKKGSGDTTVIVGRTSAAEISSMLPALTPKSPTVAALDRYGQYPVSLYTGLPTIEIPIHQFTVGSVTVPIKLTYHASGIKVNDLASWVGMGWSLQTGGMVTRSILSRPDEQGGVLGQPIVDPNSFYDRNCVTTSTDEQMRFLANNQVDSQRDLFAYSLPTASNSFILTPTSPGYVSLQPGPVSISAASGLSSFTVVDEGGTRYRFADTETTLTNPTTPNAFGDFTSAWHISEIISPTNSDRAIYTYTNAQTTNTAPEPVSSWLVNAELDESSTKPSGVQPGSLNLGLSTGGSSVYARLPTSIEFPGGKLVFVQETTARPDFGYALDYIDVMGYNSATADYTRIKRIDLGYVNKTRTNNTQVPFLDQVKLLQGDGITLIGAYQMTYNATPLPGASSLAKDYWGYYNGQSGQTLIQYRTFPVVERTNNPSTTSYPVGDAERSPDETLMKAWIIQSIRYPTGGSTQFEFETNRYKDGANTLLAGGLRLARLRNYTANGQLAQTKTYKYGQAESGVGTFRSQANKTYYSTLHLNYNEPAGTASPASYRYTAYGFSSAPTGPLTPDEGSPVTYPEVAEYMENGAGQSIGKTIHQFRDDAMDEVLPLGSKSFVTSKRWNRGQLAHQLQYNAVGTLVAQTDYEYATLADGTTTDIAGVLVQQVTSQIGSVSTRPNTSCMDPANEYAPGRTYTYSYGLVKPTRIRQTVMDMADPARKTIQVTEMDYAPSFYLLRETRRFVEGGAAGNGILGERISYPQDFGSQIPNTASSELLGIRALQRRNIFRPLETIRYRQEGTSGAKTYLTGSLTTFQTVTINGQLTALPDRTYLAETEGTGSYDSAADRYQSSGGTGNGFSIDAVWSSPRLTMTSYDANGNLLTYRLADGSSTGYTYSTYQSASGIPFSVVASQILNAGQESAQTTTYSYTIPLLGPASQTDTRGVITSYLYDAFGRLQTIRDKDGNVLKQYTYHYTSQQP